METEAHSRPTIDLRPRSSWPEVDARDAIVSRLVDFYRQLKSGEQRAGDIYRATGEWSDYVKERLPLYEWLLEGDIDKASALLSDFWRNELGPIVSQYAYFTDLQRGDKEKTQRFLDRMASDYAVWVALSPAASHDRLTVKPIGNPWGVDIAGNLVPPQAFRYDLHARHIQELVEDEARPLILEIGAGYAGTGEKLLSSDRNISYIDFDLPETAVIAAYWLMCSLGEENVGLWAEGDKPEGTRAIVAGNYLLPRLEAHVSLVLNAFSFSEMRMTNLDEYFSQLDRLSPKYLLHSNMDAPGVVNRGYERIPVTQFPISKKTWKRLYKKPDVFQGPLGDYREELYEARPTPG